MNKIISFIAATFVFLSASCTGRATTVQVTVVDETGSPVEGVTVAVGFSPVPPSKQGVSGQGVTGANGVFSFSGDGYIGFTAVATKSGYYESRVKGFINDYSAGGQGRPLDPKVTMILRPISNPIKMYARRNVDLRIPEVKVEIGFDLLEWDWCPPYGSGRVKDLVFKMDGFYKEFEDADGTLTLSFTNPDDGILEVDLEKFKESMYPWPYRAPESGYKGLISWRKARIPELGKDPATRKIEIIDDTNIHKGYVFRIRTKRDEQGNIIQAYYGTVDGAFDFGGALAGSWIRPKGISLNPNPNDKNLEAKFGESLYPNLKPDEIPREPWIGYQASGQP